MISDFSFPLSITKLPHAEDLPLPCYATKGSSGMDIHAALAFDENITLSPGKRVLIPSGLILHIPDGFEAQVRPRSGLALKNGITCLNTPGTIDSDYSEELKILLINLGEEEFTITRGMRIAQIVFSRVVKAVLDEVCPPEQSTRAGGFGSTGMF